MTRTGSRCLRGRSGASEHRRNAMAARAGRRPRVHRRRGRLVRSAIAGCPGGARSLGAAPEAGRRAAHRAERSRRPVPDAAGVSSRHRPARSVRPGLRPVDLSPAPARARPNSCHGSSGSDSCSITWRSPISAAASERRGQRDLRRLAAYPQVYAKLSGLVTEADWTHWTADQIRPYLDVAFECFGADRLMIGSDWPVCTVAADYARTMAVVTDYLSRRRRATETAVLGGNAQRFWKLKLMRMTVILRTAE